MPIEKPVFLLVDGSRGAHEIARVMRLLDDVHIAPTLAAGRAALSRRSFAGIVISTALGDDSGTMLAREARAMDATLPILMTSATVDSVRLAAAHQVDAWYLLTPVTASQITLFVERALNRRLRGLAMATLWIARHRLTGAEALVLRHAAAGLERAEIAKVRRISTATLQKHIKSILRKVKQPSFERVLARLFREAMLAR